MPDGISMLLWRCPVCRTNGALAHHNSRFRAETLRCTACHTRWQVERVVGDDYRLTVVGGNPDLVGTSQPLAAWYDLIKSTFQLEPIDRRVPSQLPDEAVYLTSAGVPLLISGANPLLHGWQDQEAPRELQLHQGQPADWQELGHGRLDLTSQRLVWDDGQRRCDLWWRRVNTIFTFFRTTFGVMYGGQVYRFQFSGESILKWLTYAATVARPIAAAEGRQINTTHF